LQDSDDEDSQNKAVIKALSATPLGSFGRQALRVVHVLDRDRSSLTVASVLTACVSFMDKCPVPMGAFKDLSDRVSQASALDDTKAVQVLEAQVKTLVRQNDELERTVETNAAAFASHVAYMEALMQDWKLGLTEAQQAVSIVSGRTQEAITLTEALHTKVNNLGGRLSQGKG
jgi:hypothetical protein